MITYALLLEIKETVALRGMSLMDLKGDCFLSLDINLYDMRDPFGYNVPTCAHITMCLHIAAAHNVL